MAASATGGGECGLWSVPVGTQPMGTWGPGHVGLALTIQAEPSGSSLSPPAVCGHLSRPARHHPESPVLPASSCRFLCGPRALARLLGPQLLSCPSSPWGHCGTRASPASGIPPPLLPLDSSHSLLLCGLCLFRSSAWAFSDALLKLSVGSAGLGGDQEAGSCLFSGLDGDAGAGGNIRPGAAPFLPGASALGSPGPLTQPRVSVQFWVCSHPLSPSSPWAPL